MVGTASAFSLWLHRADPGGLGNRRSLHQSYFLYVPYEDCCRFLHNDYVRRIAVLSRAKPGSHGLRAQYCAHRGDSAWHCDGARALAGLGAGFARQRTLRNAVGRGCAFACAVVRHLSEGQIIVVFLFAVFPVLINTYQGVRECDKNMLEVAYSFRSSEWRVWQDVLLPFALPYIIAGIRLAIGRGLIGMIIAEFYTTISGLGFMITRYANVFEMDKTFVPVIVLM